MQLVTEDFGNTCLVRIGEPRIDAAVAIQFKEALRAVARDGSPCLLLDLSGVSFLDSSGLGALVAAMNLIGPGQRLELATLQPSVQRVFSLTRLDTLFTIHPSVGNALGPSHRLADAG